MLHAADAWSTRLRATSTRAEGFWTVLWGILLGLGLFTVLQRFAWWEGAAGIALLIAFYVVVGIVNWRRSAARTVRPKYFSQMWRAAGIWAGVMLVASLFLTHESDGQVNLWWSILLAVLCAAPTIACGIWLVARGR